MLLFKNLINRSGSRTTIIHASPSLRYFSAAFSSEKKGHLGEGLRTDEEMKIPHGEQRTFKREDEGMGGRAQESTSSFGGLKHSEAPKNEV